MILSLLLVHDLLQLCRLDSCYDKVLTLKLLISQRYEINMPMGRGRGSTNF